MCQSREAYLTLDKISLGLSCIIITESWIYEGIEHGYSIDRLRVHVNTENTNT